jgi:hypothetical protein
MENMYLFVNLKWIEYMATQATFSGTVALTPSPQIGFNIL